MATLNCRGCNTHLNHVVIDLGNCPPANSFIPQEKLSEPETFYPLKVYVCDKCFLVQIGEMKDHKEIFNESYPYFSSYSKDWLEHSKKFVEMAIQKFNLNENSSVVEIGSNDGYLLQYFSKRDIPVLGIDPSIATARVAHEKNIETLTDFFGEDLAKRLSERRGRANLLIGNNILAHVPNLHDFIGGLEIMLENKGAITLEFPHVKELIEKNEFDTIYHEHFSYFSLTSIKPIFEMHGLELFDVEKLPTHGGSLRLYVKHKTDGTKEISKRIEELLDEEEAIKIKDVSYYKTIRKGAKKVKFDLVSTLIGHQKAGDKVCAYGAAAKGNTLLNYCRVDRDLIPFVVDITPAKQGKFLPGSHIPIMPEAELELYKPNYILVLPWNHKHEIARRLAYTQDWGAELIIPIPTPHLYDEEKYSGKDTLTRGKEIIPATG